MAWADPVFVPFDYGYFAFVYDKQKVAAPPKSFEELLNGPADWKILIEDPRSSTPGLGLLMWVRKRLWRPGAGDLAEARNRASSPSARAGAKPTACSSMARRRWC